VNIAQYHIEQFLLDEARKYPQLISIRWASTVSAVQHTPAGCTLQITNALGSYALSTDWLVAADGGQSFVRKSLDLKLEGQAFTGKFVIVDIELASDFPTERRAWFDCASNPGSTMLMHKQPDNIWRIDYQISDGADLDAAIKEENVRPVVQRHLEMLGEAHLPWTYIWSSAYRAGTMTLERYVHGRVIFAGNAAHALPIFGVRGLNSGIDDADNLAWKLAAVVKGQAGDQLLQSYSTERVAAYHTNAHQAGKSTEFMAPGSRGFALMREAALSLSLQHSAIANLVNPRQTTAVAYSDAWGLGDTFDDGLAVGSAPADVPVQLGSVAEHPQPPTPTAHLCDDLQTAFSLLVLGYVQGDSAHEIQQQLPSLQVRTFNRANDSHGLLAKTWGWQRAVLLRPDGHVLARYAHVSAQRIAQDINTMLQGVPHAH
jgi:3-(3-hydroxy-phenyl)propionate hydroxylase